MKVHFGAIKAMSLTQMSRTLEIVLIREMFRTQKEREDVKKAWWKLGTSKGRKKAQIIMHDWVVCRSWLKLGYSHDQGEGSLGRKARGKNLKREDWKFAALTLTLRERSKDKDSGVSSDGVVLNSSWFQLRTLVPLGFFIGIFFHLLKILLLPGFSLSFSRNVANGVSVL